MPEIDLEPLAHDRIVQRGRQVEHVVGLHLVARVARDGADRLRRAAVLRLAVEEVVERGGGGAVRRGRGGPW
jgi:hypothetical protein